MKRSVLSPEQAAWLAQTFDRNRKYAGMRMMADEGGDGGDDKSDEGKSDEGKSDAGKSDAELGEGGKKALEAEREARKAAEDQVKTLKGEFDGFKSALLEGLGIKSDDKDKGDDALTTVQQELALIRQESAVLKLANTHKITDEGDLKILASATDAEQMKALAERLAPVEGEPDTKSRRPKPDPSQGGGSGGSTDNSGVSHGRDLFKASRSKSS